MTLYARFAAHLDTALDALVAAGTLPAGLERRAITVEPPRDTSHGDLATNAAMVLAKPAGANPRALAETIAAELGKLDDVAEVSVAGPGFINLRLTDDTWRDELRAITAEGDGYGRSAIGAGITVNVEYVSANPTGPMHMGHCRGAVVGDALASLLEFVGHKVIREYYVNDAGGQVDVLARSAHLRYREALGEDIGEIPEGLYPGDYLKPVGAALAEEFGERFVGKPESEWLVPVRKAVVASMMALIKADLALLGITHEVFASEAVLQAAGKPEAAEQWLRERGFVYDGVLEAPKGETPEDWEPVELPLFRSTQFGDDQDRPIKKSDGSWTYFGADLAYHFQKSQEADQLIDIWGADHAGTVKRIVAAVEALTGGKTRFDVKLVQMVRLLRAGEPVKMSKRSGNFVTLADVVGEVGKDVVRFTMLTRKADAQMDFDFAKVVEASKDNPVFYVQYAHARIASLHRRAAEAGVVCGEADLSLLDTAELSLVKRAAQFPRVAEGAALAREPHRIAFYLYDLAAEFHALWNLGKRQSRAAFPDCARNWINLRATFLGQCDRAGCPQWPPDHGGGSRPGDELMSTQPGEPAIGDDDRLPWLETADDDYGNGPSIWRILILAVLVLALVAAGVFGWQWYRSQGGVAGTGELINAQEGDYKVKPDQPGGMKVEGEGDTVFAASEGAATNASIDARGVPETPVQGKAAPAARPTQEKGAAKVAAAVPTSAVPLQPKAPAAAPRGGSGGSGGAVVQLGSFPDAASANTAWTRLAKRFSYLAPLTKSVETATVKGKPVYRLRVNAGSSAQAGEICGKLKIAGEPCFVAN